MQLSASMWVPLVKPFLSFYQFLLSLSLRLRGHPFAVGLLTDQHALEEVSRSRSAAGKP
jgi:hypothetical protein